MKEPELHIVITKEGIKEFKIIGRNEQSISIDTPSNLLLSEINSKIEVLLESKSKEEKPKTEKKMLTLNEASEIYSIKLWTLRSWANQRKIPMRRLGRRLYIPVKAFEQWLSERETKVMG